MINGLTPVIVEEFWQSSYAWSPAWFRFSHFPGPRQPAGAWKRPTRVLLTRHRPHPDAATSRRVTSLKLRTGSTAICAMHSGPTATRERNFGKRNGNDMFRARRRLRFLEHSILSMRRRRHTSKQATRRAVPQRLRLRRQRDERASELVGGHRASRRPCRSSTTDPPKSTRSRRSSFADRWSPLAKRPVRHPGTQCPTHRCTTGRALSRRRRRDPQPSLHVDRHAKEPGECAGQPRARVPCAARTATWSRTDSSTIIRSQGVSP